MKFAKAALWSLNVLLAAASLWLLWPSHVNHVRDVAPPDTAAPCGLQPVIPWDALISLRLPLGPRTAGVEPEVLPRVYGVLTGTEPGSGVAFLEDPKAKTEFAVLRGDTVGPWTVESVAVEAVILRGPAGERVLRPSDRPRK